MIVVLYVATHAPRMIIMWSRSTSWMVKEKWAKRKDVMKEIYLINPYEIIENWLRIEDIQLLYVETIRKVTGGS